MLRDIILQKIKGILVSTLLLLSLLAIIAPVSAGIIHVYPGADLTSIVKDAPAGSTIYVHAGTYHLLYPIKINADNINLIGDGALTTLIEPKDSSVGMLIDNYGNNLKITGFTFRNIASGSYAIVIQNNTNNTTISSNIIRNNSNGIRVQNLSTATIKNNLIFGNDDYGIYTRSDSNVTIINNTLLSNYSGIYIDVGKATIRNNIIVSNENFGIGGNSPTLTVEYNNVWNNGTNYGNNVTPDTENISKDPRFDDRVDAFYLSTSSPCIDRGLGESYTLGLYERFTTRVDGKWDTGTVDMGYHYDSYRGAPGTIPTPKILKILKGKRYK